MADYLSDILQQWNDYKFKVLSITVDSSHEEYNEAVLLCQQLHPHFRNVGNVDEYTMFLSAYANVLSTREENLESEIELQEEIVALRRGQVASNRAQYIAKLANSLFYAAMLHRRANNVHRAIDAIEESVACERVAVEEYATSAPEQLAIKCYYLANTYAATGRNILADDAYKETVGLYNELIDKGATPAHETRMMLAQILIEYADFYYSTRFVDNALDRYQQAIEVLRLLPNEGEVSKLLYNMYVHLSAIYKQIGNDNKSRYYNSLAEETQK